MSHTFIVTISRRYYLWRELEIKSQPAIHTEGQNTIIFTLTWFKLNIRPFKACALQQFEIAKANAWKTESHFKFTHFENYLHTTKITRFFSTESNWNFLGFCLIDYHSRRKVICIRLIEFIINSAQLIRILTFVNYLILFNHCRFTVFYESYLRSESNIWCESNKYAVTFLPANNEKSSLHENKNLMRRISRKCKQRQHNDHLLT